MRVKVKKSDSRIRELAHKAGEIERAEQLLVEDLMEERAEYVAGLAAIDAILAKVRPERPVDPGVVRENGTALHPTS